MKWKEEGVSEGTNGRNLSIQVATVSILFDSINALLVRSIALS